MLSLRFAILFFLCPAFLGDWSELQATILGRDDRVRVDKKVVPYNRIFKLSPNCTAALVGESLILTAAHCIERQVLTANHGKVTFPPKLVDITDEDRGSPLAYVTQGEVGTLNSDRFWHVDWALLEIDRPLGKERGFFSADASLLLGTDGWKNITSAGFPVDRAEDGLLAHIGCSLIVHFWGNAFRMDCDGWTGSSGGPLLKKTAQGEWRVIGIWVRGEKQYVPEGSPKGNVGITATEFAADLKNYLEKIDSRSKSSENK